VVIDVERALALGDEGAPVTGADVLDDDEEVVAVAVQDLAQDPGERKAGDEKLPPAQREVIVLKIWNRCTFEAIGDLLEISPNTAAGRYRYGLEKLRTCLRGENYERDEKVGDAIAFLDATPPVGGA